jgi:formylglycine-generating enzyme required for sulfatase activity
MKFCLIPAGSFEREGHTVTISRDFWMAKYPVTQGEWTAVMGSNPSLCEQAGERAPVEMVSWDDARAFLAKAGAAAYDTTVAVVRAWARS